MRITQVKEGWFEVRRKGELVGIATNFSNALELSFIYLADKKVIK